VAKTKTNTHRTLVGKLLGKHPLGRPARLLKDGAKIYHVGIDSEVEKRSG
jgi:hypothetical protein